MVYLCAAYVLPMLAGASFFIAFPTILQIISGVQKKQNLLKSATDPSYVFNRSETYDYIIIGGGSAGAVVANRLSKSRKNKVILLERGGNPNPYVNIPSVLEYLKHVPNIDYSYKIVKQKNSCLSRPCYFVRGQGLGGTSNLYHMTVLRGNPKDFDNWASITDDKTWSYKNVLEVFKSLDDYHGYYQPINTSVYGLGGESYVSAQIYEVFPKYFYKAAKELGWKEVDFNAQPEVGYGHLDLNVKHGRRWGSYAAFIQPILNRKNLVIYKYSQAIQIIFDENMVAVGVLYKRHGKIRFVKAKREIIVCAGAIDSPKLLMLSGIGPFDQLKSFGIKPLLNLPVGTFMQDHVGMTLQFYVNTTGISFIPERDITPSIVSMYLKKGKGPLSSPFFNSRTLAYYASKGFESDWPDVELMARAEYLDTRMCNGTYKDSFILPGYILRPKSSGVLKLASKDPSVPPIIDTQYFSHRSDVDKLVEGMRYYLKLLDTNSFKSLDPKLKYYPACGSPKNIKSRKFLECVMKHYTETVCHPIGTCRMGRIDDPKAVVDSKLRVIGTKKLRVVDTSVIPKMIVGHTHTTALMIGQQAANFILRKKKNKS